MTGDFGTIGIAVLACVVLVIIGFMVGGLIRRKREDAEWSKSLNSCVRASEMASKSRFQHITDTDKDHVFSPKDLGFEDRDDDPDPDGDEDDDSWDEEEDEEEGPPVPEWRAAHYYCNDCGGEFRMPEGIVPKKCPFCDADTIMDMDEDEPDVEEDSLLFVCPHCKREFHMRDAARSSGWTTIRKRLSSAPRAKQNLQLLINTPFPRRMSPLHIPAGPAAAPWCCLTVTALCIVHTVAGGALWKK